jgi:hypothetical protein
MGRSSVALGYKISGYETTRWIGPLTERVARCWLYWPKFHSRPTYRPLASKYWIKLAI